MAERRIHTGDEYAADEFEMLTLSRFDAGSAYNKPFLGRERKTGIGI